MRMHPKHQTSHPLPGLVDQIDCQSSFIPTEKFKAMSQKQPEATKED
jgi:hypothetical protein